MSELWLTFCKNNPTEWQGFSGRKILLLWYKCVVKVNYLCSSCWRLFNTDKQGLQLVGRVDVPWGTKQITTERPAHESNSVMTGNICAGKMCSYLMLLSFLFKGKLKFEALKMPSAYEGKTPCYCRLKTKN